MTDKPNTKDSYVRIRLSQNERQQLNSIAKKLDVNMSEVIRQFIKERHIELEGQLAMFKTKK